MRIPGEAGKQIHAFLLRPGLWKWVLAAAILFRFGILFLSGQLHTDFYWEYGLIARNLIAGNGYSFPFTDSQLNFLPDSVYPSALMPPGYVFFLIPFLLIGNVLLRNFLLFSVQIGIASLAMYLGFDLTRKKAGLPIAVLSLTFQGFMPDLAFAPCTIGPTVWFHFLLVFFLWLEFEKEGRFRLPLQILSAGLLVLMRSEALLFLGVFAFIKGWSGKKKQAAFLMAGIGICLSPWLLRNYRVLGKPLLSANAGINFYRGNNPGEIGDWPPSFNAPYLEMRNHPETFEVRYDAYAFSLATDWIRTHPLDWLRNLPVKLVRFWVVDWPDPRTRSPFYFLPWLVCFALGLAGLRKENSRNMQAEKQVFLVYTLIILVFFPQVRYLTLIKFFWMPFAALGFRRLLP